MAYTSRQILIGLHNKMGGNWEKIYDFIVNKKPLDFELDLSNENELITIVDSEYPNELKNQYKPSFVITKEQATEKVYEITYKVRVIAHNEAEAKMKVYNEYDIGSLTFKGIKIVR